MDVDIERGSAVVDARELRWTAAFRTRTAWCTRCSTYGPWLGHCSVGVDKCGLDNVKMAEQTRQRGSGV